MRSAAAIAAAVAAAIRVTPDEEPIGVSERRSVGEDLGNAMLVELVLDELDKLPRGHCIQLDALASMIVAREKEAEYDLRRAIPRQVSRIAL